MDLKIQEGILFRRIVFMIYIQSHKVIQIGKQKCNQPIKIILTFKVKITLYYPEFQYCTYTTIFSNIHNNIYVTILFNIPNSIYHTILHIHHKILEYTSQGIAHISQDIEQIPQDFRIKQRCTRHNSCNMLMLTCNSFMLRVNINISTSKNILLIHFLQQLFVSY